MLSKFMLTAMLASALCAMGPQKASAQLLAFPGAVGFGSLATGGRGGTVYHVTNLNNSGAGSFRDAVSVSGRIVVFDVSGYIVLASPVPVKSNLTIAGETAPGEGIGLMGAELSMSGNTTGSTNCIVRFLRLRDGTIDPNAAGNPPGSSSNCVNLLNASNIIFDHCSLEFAAYNGIDAVGCSDITVQNCILADPIGQQFNAHTESVGKHFTWYRNIFANAHNRSPLAKIDDQFINNVVYNYQAGYTTGNTSTGFSHDIVKNYFIAGPSTSTLSDYFYQMGDTKQKYYVSGNLADTSRDGSLGGSNIGTPSGGTTLSAPWAATTSTIPTLSATDAFNSVIANAGALPRDDVDTDVITDVLSLGTRGRMWGSQTSNGLSNSGYGAINGGTKLLDTDNDGMPDVWERQYGLNPNDPSDAATDFDGTGYSNIEKYINSIVDGTYPIGVPVDLSYRFNGAGISTNGTANGGGIDGGGGAFSLDYLDTTLTAGRFTYNIGGPDTGDFVGAFGQTVLLPLTKASALTFLAASGHGSPLNQKFSVRYTDGSIATFKQSISSWASPLTTGNTGEAIGLTMAFQNTASGAAQRSPVYLYQYSFALNPAKTVRSITLPNNPAVSVLAMTLVPAAPLVQSGLVYKLTPQHAEAQGEVLDVAGGGTASGTNVDILAYAGLAQQQWQIDDQGGGYYRLTPLNATSLALDVGAGNNADASTWTGAPTQLWRIIDLGTGYAELTPQSNEAAGQALDVAGVRTADGTNVDIYRYGNGTNQHWKLSPIIPLVSAGATYRLVPLNATALSLSVTGGGVVVDVETTGGGSGTSSQQWTLTDAGGGYFRVTPASATGFALTVSSLSQSAAPTSEVWTGAAGQLWSFVNLGNGAARIMPKLDIDAAKNGALDVAGSHTTSGSAVDIYQIAAGTTGGTNEQWQLVRVR